MTASRQENTITLEAAGQTTLNPIMRGVTNHQSELLYRRFAMMCYMCSFPFMFGTNHYLMDWIRGMGTNYKPPSIANLAGYLLEDSYKSVKHQVSELISQGTRFSVSIDESTNIALHRILVLTISFATYNFFITAEDLGRTSMTAEATCTLVLNLLMELFKGNLSLLNAFSTDTCNQMRATWKGLSLISEFQHCFFIPCDSHGLQLLIKDLLVEKKAKRGQPAIIPTAIQRFFKKAYRIIVAF